MILVDTFTDNIVKLQVLVLHLWMCKWEYLDPVGVVILNYQDILLWISTGGSAMSMPIYVMGLLMNSSTSGTLTLPPPGFDSWYILKGFN